MENNTSLFGPDGRPLKMNRQSLLRDYGLDSSAKEYKSGSFYDFCDDLVGRKGLEIYDTMMNEVEIEQSVDAIRYSIISEDWQVEPASDAEEDIEIADFVRWNFQNLRGSVRMFFYQVLCAIYLGYSVTEKKFEIVKGGEYAGKWIISEFKSKWPGDYRIQTDEYLNFTGLVLDAIAAGKETPVPREKFVVYQHNPRYGRPYGWSVLRKVYKHYWSKDFLLKWWNIYCETYGMPTRVAKIPAGAYAQTRAGDEASQNRIQQVLKDIMNNTAITIPDDIAIDFIEIAHGGAAAFQKAIEYHDKEITKGIQGQVLTSGQGDGSSSYALGQVHGETKLDYTSAVRAQLEDEIMHEQVIAQLVALNFTSGRCPKFSLSPRAKTLEQLTADELLKLTQTGIIVGSDYDIIRRKIGLPPLSISRATGESPIPEKQEPEIKTPSAAPGEYAHARPSDKPGFSRPLNKIEKRADFERYAKQADIDEQTIIEAQSKIVDAMKNKMIAWLPGGIFAGGRVLTGKVQEIKLQYLNDFKREYKKLMTEAIERQWEIAYKEIDGGALKKYSRKEIEFERAGITESEFAAIKVAVGQRTPGAEVAKLKTWITDGAIEKIINWRAMNEKLMDDKINAMSDAVTETVKNDILAGVKQKIFFGAQNGLSTDRILKEVSKVFENYIARPDAKNIAEASARGIESLVRTNYTNAMSELRLDVAREGLATGFYPALQYSAIRDDRTSEICEELDGMIYAADDPIWDIIRPPNRDWCRSTLIGVYKDDVPEKYSPQPDISKIPESFRFGN